MKIILEIKFYFISTFRKSTVGGFVNQLIKKFWPYYGGPTASKKNADRRDAHSTIASISQATQWHRQWTLWGRIKRRPTARTLSILKTNAVGRPLKRSAVGSPCGRHSRAVRSPTAQLDLRARARRSLCKRRGHPWYLHGYVTLGPNTGNFAIKN